MEDVTKEKVAIIGAGVIGLYLAWRLKQKGHEVVVFEKKDKIGGKPCTALVSERIKEYLQSCCQKQDLNQEIDKVLSCIADILRQEEERVTSTDSGLKEVLVLLESDKPADQMQLALAQITIEPKEPKMIEQ